MVAQLATQLGSGGSIPTSSLQFRIKPISNGIAKSWVEKWHYSKRIPTGKNICYGLFHDRNLYAVIVYGIGVNPYQAQFLKVASVVEIKRLCRSEPRLAYPLSRFIRLTVRMVAKEMNFDCVVAFADPEYGHEGIVYKACGFVLEGFTNPEWHTVDSEGEVRHRRYAFRFSRRHDISIEEAREQLGLSRKQTKPKYRWVLRSL